MISPKVLGLFTIVPATMLLTVSFFVMFTLGKIAKSSLRVFGMALVALLWIAALIIFSAGVMIVSRNLGCCGYHGMDKSGKCAFSSSMSFRR